MRKPLFRWLLPDCHCLHCQDPRQLDAGQALCDACRAGLHDQRLTDGICPTCLSPKQSGSPCAYCLSGGMDNIDVAFAPFRFHGEVVSLIHALKFERVCDAALPLAEAMRQTLGAYAVDMVIPIPLHKRRQLLRGYNQSAILIDRMQLPYPTVHALKRSKNTRAQSSLAHANTRQSNVRDAFSLIADVQGKRILLVDDVRTTGATLRAASRVLKQGGAATVAVLTAAIAHHPIKENEIHAR